MPSKPGRWAVSPAEIDPQYLSFWRDLTFLAPYWEGSGRSYDIKGRMSGVLAANSVWGVGESGLTVDFGAGSDIIDYGDMQDNPDWPFGNGGDITVVSMFRAPSGSDFRWMMDADDESTGPANGTGTNRVFQFRIDTNDKVGWIPFDASQTPVSVASSASYADNKWHIAVGRLQGTAITIWVDGVQDGSGTLGAGGIRGPGTTNLGAGDEDIDVALNAVWHRALSDAEIRLLQLDPFGPIRPAPIFGGLTVTLFATADGSITDVVNEADAASPLWSSIDDDPATPTDTDWINNAIDPGTVQYFPLVTDMPGDFDTATSATIIVRYRGVNFSSGSLTLHVQFYQSDESTALSDEVAAVVVSANSSFDNTAPVTITGIVAGTKTLWDGARLRLRWA